MVLSGLSFRQRLDRWHGAHSTPFFWYAVYGIDGRVYEIFGVLRMGENAGMCDLGLTNWNGRCV